MMGKIGIMELFLIFAVLLMIVFPIALIMRLVTKAGSTGNQGPSLDERLERIEKDISDLKNKS